MTNKPISALAEVSPQSNDFVAIERGGLNFKVDLGNVGNYVAGNGIDIASTTISADINTTNLQFTAGEINTIQDIDTTATPAFTGMTLDAGGLVNTNLHINGSTDFTIRATATDEFVIRDATAAANRVTLDSSGNLQFNAYGAGFLQTDSSGNVTAGAIGTGDLPSTVMLEGENISLLTNDAGYLTNITGESVTDLSDVNMDVTNGVVYWDGDSLETSTGITWDGSSLNLTTPIDFADTVGDKIYWFSNAYGTGIEGGTLAHWAATRHRLYIGGITTGGGTNVFELDINNLTLGVNILLTSGHNVVAKSGFGLLCDGDGFACLFDNDFTDIGTDATQSEWRYFRDSNFSAGGTYPRIMVHRGDGTFNPRFELDCNDGNFTAYSGNIYASAGRLGIGTITPSTDGGTGFQASIKNSSDQYLLYLASTSATGDMMLAFGQSNTRTAYIQYLDSGDLFRITNEYGPLVFLTGTSGSETEKLRLETSGNLTVKSNSNFLKDSGVTWYVGATGAGTFSHYDTTMIPQNMGTQKLWVGQASTIGTVVGQCFVGFGKGLTTYAGSGLPSVTNTVYAYYGSLTKSTAEGGTLYAQYNNLQDVSTSGTGAYLEGVRTQVVRSGANSGSLTGQRLYVRCTNASATVSVLTGLLLDTANSGTTTTYYGIRFLTDSSTYGTAYSFYNPNNWRMVQAGAATIGSTGSQRQELTVYDNATGVDYLQASFGTTGSIAGIEFFNSSGSYEFQASGDNFFLYDRGDTTYVWFYNGGTNRIGINTITPGYTLEVNGTFQADDYFSGDGTQGRTGTVSFYDVDSFLHEVEFKDGLCVSWQIDSVEQLSAS